MLATVGCTMEVVSTACGVPLSLSPTLGALLSQLLHRMQRDMYNHLLTRLHVKVDVMSTKNIQITKIKLGIVLICNKSIN